MKAIYLESESKPVVLRTDLPEPVLRAGGVIVRIEAVPVLSYTRKVFDGSLKYVTSLPSIPGNSGVGIVEAISEEVTHLKVGQRVSIDPRITPHVPNKADEADSILIGLTASTPASQKIQAIWKNGSYAEKALLPGECLTPLDALAHLSPERLSIFSHLAIPYGGLLRGNFRAGQTIIINGATGAFGARAVLVALAIGASRVIAVGRNAGALEKLKTLDSQRVVSVALQKGAVEGNQKMILEAAGAEGADFYFDMLGRVEDADSILVCLGVLRHRGTAVFMGGARIPVPINYGLLMSKELSVIGNFMYPRHAINDLVRMVAAKTLDLENISLRTFPIEQFETALDAAEKSKGLEGVAVTFNR